MIHTWLAKCLATSPNTNGLRSDDDRHKLAFQNDLKKLNTFIFSEHVRAESEAVRELTPFEEDKIKDSPFDVIHIECANDILTQSRIGGVNCTLQSLIYNDVEKRISTVSLAVDYGVLALFTFTDTDEENDSVYRQLLTLVQKYVELINTGKHAVVEAKNNYKIKRNYGTTYHTTNRVILIGKTVTQIKKATGIPSEKMDFSHRFFRRGHWRRIEVNKMGKNRSGEYIEVGRTWVLEAIIGDESKPLITKQRIVKNEIA